MNAESTLFRRLADRVTQVRPGEWPGLIGSFAYFFCLLSSYYVLRPVRDEMGIQAGVGNLPWLFTATFFTMLAAVPAFGWVSSSFPRRRFLPYVYLFFVTNLVAFYCLFAERVALSWTTKAFFVWVSVFNLFVVSVFWSFMADLYDTGEARRLYGLIAAGGSLGAICGPAATTLLAPRLGPVNLLLVSALLLSLAVLCVWRLGRWSASRAAVARSAGENAVAGGFLDGIRVVARSRYLLAICLYVALFSVLSTLLYLQQQQIVKATIAAPGQRTALFATLDLVVNLLTLGLQIFAFAPLVRWFGIAAGLVAVPALSIPGFLALGLVPTLAILIVFGVTRRAAEFAICKPARETLFNALSAEEKYKGKNFMDTVVYRGGDMASGWVFTGLQSVGLALTGISLLAVPVAAAWAGIGLWLTQHHRRSSMRPRARHASSPVEDASE